MSRNRVPGESSASLAHAVAAISVSLPGAPASAGHRLAEVMAVCDAHDFSEATRAALARRFTPWLALAIRFGRPIRELENMDPTALLNLLRAAQPIPGRTDPAAADADDELVPDEPLYASNTTPPTSAGSREVTAHASDPSAHERCPP